MKKRARHYFLVSGELWAREAFIWCTAMGEPPPHHLGQNASPVLCIGLQHIKEGKVWGLKHHRELLFLLSPLDQIWHSILFRWVSGLMMPEELSIEYYHPCPGTVLFLGEHQPITQVEGQIPPLPNVHFSRFPLRSVCLRDFETAPLCCC